MQCARNMYFGYFVTTPDAVCILDGTGIIAFDAHLNEKWKIHGIAIDGVVFKEIIDNWIMKISCQNLPERWYDLKIDIRSGNIVM